MKLQQVTGSYAVVRLPPETAVPEWVDGAFVSVTRTAAELSLVVGEEHVPDDLDAERDWRLLAVEGPIEFTEVGILASLAGALAAARVSLFAISTFDTDYLLVKASSLERALDALRRAGHEVERVG